MTIFCQEYIPSMQNFRKENSRKTIGCESNKIDYNTDSTMAMSIEYNDSDHKPMSTSSNSKDSYSKSKNMGKRSGRRPGRKPAKIDERAKLERSRQSAKECRARKKLRYQYLEELVLNREKAVFTLREELEMCKTWCKEVDKGVVPSELQDKIAMEDVAMTSLASSSSNLNEGEITVVDFSSTFSFDEQNLNAPSDTGSC